MQKALYSIFYSIKIFVRIIFTIILSNERTIFVEMVWYSVYYLPTEVKNGRKTEKNARYTRRDANRALVDFGRNRFSNILIAAI